MKHPHKIIYLIALLFFFNYACKPSENKNKKLSFGFKEVIQLSDSEEEMNLEKFIDLHEYIWDYDNFNLPLNKLIKGEDYFIFIAAAIENNEHEVIELLSNTEDFTILEETESSKFLKEFLYQKKDELFIYSVIFVEKVQQIPFIVSVVSENEIFIKNSFTEKFLNDKIN